MVTKADLCMRGYPEMWDFFSLYSALQGPGSPWRFQNSTHRAENLPEVRETDDNARPMPSNAVAELDDVKRAW